MNNIDTDLVVIAERLRVAAAALAKVCDGARKRDDVGFSASDTAYGRAIAWTPAEQWTELDCLAVSALLHRYRGQLEGMGFSLADIPWVIDQVDRESNYREFKERAEAARELRMRDAYARNEITRQQVESVAPYLAWVDRRMLAIRSPRDAELIAAIKALPGRRRWNGDERRWEIELSQDNARALPGLIATFGILISDADRELVTAERTAQTVAAPSAVLREHITVEDGKFVLATPYNPQATAAIKEILGRAWVAPKKVWTVPVSKGALATIRELAGRYGWHASEATWAAAEQVVTGKAANVVASKAADADVALVGMEDGVTPYPYQRAGIAYAMRQRRVLIADDMGLGKTPQALLTVAQVDAFPALVVAPKSVVRQWARETRKFLKGRTASIVGLKGNAKRLARQGLVAGLGGDVVIVNYERLNALVDKIDVTPKPAPGMPEPKKKYEWPLRPEARPFRSLIMDESHYVKNAKVDRARRAKALAGKDDLACTILLTGTPVLNRPIELTHQLDILGRLGEFGGFMGFAKRYCTPPDAPVLMADFTSKRIGDIVIGDKVIGWKRGTQVRGTRRSTNGQRRLVDAEVLQVLRRKSELQRVTFYNGETVVSTPDHLWLNGFSNGIFSDELSEYSAARSGYLGKGRGSCSSAIKICDGIDDYHEFCDEYKKGYIIGSLRGDGWCTKTEKIKTELFRFQRETISLIGHSVGIAANDCCFIDRVELFLRDIGIESYRSLSSGMHRISFGNESAFNTILGFDSARDSMDFWRGFLGGIYDAEGSGLVMSQDEAQNAETHAMICRALDAFGFDYKKSKTGMRIRGGRKSLIRFWEIATPCVRRKLVSYMMNSGGRFMSDRLRVAKIEKIDGLHDVVTLTTTTGNYVVYGIGSKNCAAHETKYGWDMNGASNMAELNTLLRERCMVRREKADVLAELPALRRASVPVEVDDPRAYRDAIRDVVAWMAANRGTFPSEEAYRAEALVKIEGLRQLAARSKYASGLEWLTTWLEAAEGQKLVLFAHHRDIQEKLKADLAAFGAVSISGGDSDDNRDAAVKRFWDDPTCRVIVCSIKAASVGLNLQCATNVAFFEFAWHAADMDQAEARCHRIGVSAAVMSYWLIGEDTFDEDMIALIESKREVAHAAVSGGEIEKQANVVAWFEKLIERKRTKEPWEGN